MGIWKQTFDLQQLNENSKNSMVEYLGIIYTEVGEDFFAGQMEVDNRTRQPYGILHGGASCVFAETLGSVAANLCVDEEFHCVGLDINANHLRPLTKGSVFGVAQPFHIGRTTQVWGIEIKGEHDKLICIARLTLAVVKK